VARTLVAWLEQRRLVPAGPVREVYLKFGARDPESLRLPRQFVAGRPEELLTEVQIPVRVAAAQG